MGIERRETDMILETAKKVIQLELDALCTLLETVDANLEKAARTIQGAKGRVVVTGIGSQGTSGYVKKPIRLGLPRPTARPLYWHWVTHSQSRCRSIGDSRGKKTFLSLLSTPAKFLFDSTRV